MNIIKKPPYRLFGAKLHVITIKRSIKESTLYVVVALKQEIGGSEERNKWLSSEIIFSSDLFDKIRALRIDEIKSRYHLLHEMFDSSMIDDNMYSPICWMHLPNGQNPDDFEQLCLKNNLRICSASRFMIGNISIPNAIRISLISEHTFERYQKGLIILKKLL